MLVLYHFASGCPPGSDFVLVCNDKHDIEGIPALPLGITKIPDLQNFPQNPRKYCLLLSANQLYALNDNSIME